MWDAHYDHRHRALRSGGGSDAGEEVRRDTLYISIADRRRRKDERRKEDQSEPGPSTPPFFSLEAEQSLVGALLLDNGAFSKIAGIVNSDHFYRDDHRRIFQHIVRIIESGEGADVATVFASIEASNEVDQTGGLAYLGDIANNTPSAANILTYARIVRERALMRSLADYAEKVALLPHSALPIGEQMKQAQDAWKALAAEYRSYSDQRSSSGSKSAS